MAGVQRFSWKGPGIHRGPIINFPGFFLNEVKYEVGDNVYLLPEDDKSPLYVARILRAYEDRECSDVDRHCIEVRWFERKQNLPLHIQEQMHDMELCELDSNDVNSVGCIDGKATVLYAATHEEAVRMAPGRREVFFCRGMYDQDLEKLILVDRGTAMFRNPHATPFIGKFYNPCNKGKPDDPPYDPLYRPDTDGPHSSTAVWAPANPYAPPPNGFLQNSPVGPLSAPPNPQVPILPNGNTQGALPAAGGRQRRAKTATPQAPPGPVVATVGVLQPQVLPAPPDEPGRARRAAGGVRTDPNTRCCVECGATQTPQWREGPSGPKTLCNACGLRYARSQQMRHGKSKGGGGGAAAAAAAAASAPHAQALALPAPMDWDDDEEEEEEGGGGGEGGTEGGKDGDQPQQEEEEEAEEEQHVHDGGRGSRKARKLPGSRGGAGAGDSSSSGSRFSYSDSDYDKSLPPSPSPDQPSHGTPPSKKHKSNSPDPSSTTPRSKKARAGGSTERAAARPPALPDADPLESDTMHSPALHFLHQLNLPPQEADDAEAAADVLSSLILKNYQLNPAEEALLRGASPDAVDEEAAAAVGGAGDDDGARPIAAHVRDQDMQQEALLAAAATSADTGLPGHIPTKRRTAMATRPRPVGGGAPGFRTDLQPAAADRGRVGAGGGSSAAQQLGAAGPTAGHTRPGLLNASGEPTATPAPLLQSVGVDTAAAVNLLSMSVREADLMGHANRGEVMRRAMSNVPLTEGPGISPEALEHLQAQMYKNQYGPAGRLPPAPHQAPPPPPNPAPRSHPERLQPPLDFMTTIARAEKFYPPLGALRQVMETFSEVLAHLPPDKVGELVRVREAVDAATKEAAAADAAVQAVSKVLAAKREILDKAQKNATLALNRFSDLMTALSAEHSSCRPPAASSAAPPLARLTSSSPRPSSTVTTGSVSLQPPAAASESHAAAAAPASAPGPQAHCAAGAGAAAPHAAKANGGMAVPAAAAACGENDF